MGKSLTNDVKPLSTDTESNEGKCGLNFETGFQTQRLPLTLLFPLLTLVKAMTIYLTMMNQRLNCYTRQRMNK